MTNFIYIWDSEYGFSNRGFINMINERKYDANKLIQISSDMIKTKYSYIVLDGIVYEMMCNIVIGGHMNFIAVIKY